MKVISYKKEGLFARVELEMRVPRFFKHTVRRTAVANAYGYGIVSRFWQWEDTGESCFPELSTLINLAVNDYFLKQKAL